MNQNVEQEDVYVVQCVWCGAKIRKDNEEESTGVCLKCFYQMLTNHLQSQKQTAHGESVSDR